jgi:hypothetical protein
LGQTEWELKGWVTGLQAVAELEPEEACKMYQKQIACIVQFCDTSCLKLKLGSIEKVIITLLGSKIYRSGM